MWDYGCMRPVNFQLNLPDDDDDDARVHLKYHGSIAGSHYP